jgi:hypothetical protein
MDKVDKVVMGHVEENLSRENVAISPLGRMSCGGCRFWAANDTRPPPTEIPVGECHRRAPMAFASADPVLQRAWASWPHTSGDDFCGEFAPKRETVGFV